MTLDTILNIMSKWSLTGDELLLIYLTFISQTENGNPQEHRVYFERWYNSGGGFILRELFESLKSKGIIKKNYNPSEYDPDEIEFNQNFIKQYFKLTGELGMELWEAYPNDLWLNGKFVSLKNIGKHFKDRDQVYFKYASSIGHSISKHKEILEILDWAKQNNLIHISLVEFILSHKWEEFKELKNKGIQGQASTSEIYETV